MGFDIKKFLSIGARFIPYVGQVVSAVEAGKEAFGSGKDKEDAAVTLFHQLVEVAEGVAGKDLVKEPEVDAAIKAAFAALVNVQNVIAKVKASKV